MTEFGMIIMGVELVVTVLICWFEIWSFDQALSVQDRVNLILLYSPWAIIPGIMVWDCMNRIKARIESSKKTKAG
jgi:EXPERA (EXPanded EBP superfamily)